LYDEKLLSELVKLVIDHCSDFVAFFYLHREILDVTGNQFSLNKAIHGFHSFVKTSKNNHVVKIEGLAIDYSPYILSLFGFVVKINTGSSHSLPC